MNISSLTYSMAAILCLCIHCRIPVRIIEYHSVSTCEIYTQSSTSSGQDKAEYSFIMIESIHQYLYRIHNSIIAIIQIDCQHVGLGF